LKAMKDFTLVEMAYDPYGSKSLAIKLANEHGMEMIEHRQGWVSMSEPCKELLKNTISRKLAHGGHPILRWNADNLRVKVDESENVRPVKGKTIKRIDGIVATIMGHGRMIEGN